MLVCHGAGDVNAAGMAARAMAGVLGKGGDNGYAKGYKEVVGNCFASPNENYSVMGVEMVLMLQEKEELELPEDISLVENVVDYLFSKDYPSLIGMKGTNLLVKLCEDAEKNAVRSLKKCGVKLVEMAEKMVNLHTDFSMIGPIQALL